MNFHTHSTASRLLLAGTVLTFIIIGVVAWPRFRQALPESLNNQPVETLPPERTPAEIISGYQTELAGVASSLESTTINSTEVSKLLNTFFFSARVPDAARTPHLKAALEFQNTDPKKTDTEKLTVWKEIIKKLQTAVAAV